MQESLTPLKDQTNELWKLRKEKRYMVKAWEKYLKNNSKNFTNLEK
jgi:hypothetical protein